MDKRISQALVILFVVLFIVLHSPILHIFNSVKQVGSIPSFLVFLLSFWVIIIGLLWFISSNYINDKDHGN